MRALRWSLLCLLLVWWLPQAAFAASNKVQVLTIASPDAFENAKALTIALKRAVSRAEGWSLAPGDFSLEVLSAAFNCSEPPDEACLAKIAEQTESDRFIWGTLEKAGDQVNVHLRLFEDGATKRDMKTTYSGNLTDASDDALLTIAEDAFNQLLGVSEGILVVNAGSVTGEVLVNGKSQGEIKGGRVELLIPSGKAEVVVRARGYRDARGSVMVRPGMNAELKLDMVAVAGGSDVADERSPVSVQKVVGIGVIGVGSLVAIVGGAFWAKSSQQRNDAEFEEYRSSVPKGEDSCKAAEAAGRNDLVDLCNSNESTRKMAAILTPLGMATAAVGATLVLTAKPKRERGARITVAPTLARSAGSLDVSVQF